MLEENQNSNIINIDPITKPISIDPHYPSDNFFPTQTKKTINQNIIIQQDYCSVIIIIVISLKAAKNKMENKFNKRNIGFISPETTHDKVYYRNNQVASPKFTRKRNEVQTYAGRKIQNKPEQNQPITFISPKKYLQHPKGATDSFSSKVSTKSVTPYQSFQNILPNDQSTISSGSITSIIQPKLPTSRSFQSAEQIIARVKANQETAELKNKTQSLEKKMNEQHQKIKNLKQENQYLFSKIEDFNDIISQKNAIINQFSMMLKQKDQSIASFQNQLQLARKKKSQLQITMNLLQKSIQQSSKCSCNTVQSDDGQRQKEASQLETQKYKSQIEDLKSKIKYSQIQTNMFQKVRYDLDHQLSKNQHLKTQNRKLLAKVEELTEKTKQIPNKNDRRSPVIGRQRPLRRDSEVSLELSPEK